MNPKNYILSQRLSYLALGSIIGYFIAKNQPPIDYYMLGTFVLIAVGLSYWIGRKK